MDALSVAGAALLAALLAPSFSLDWRGLGLTAGLGLALAGAILAAPQLLGAGAAPGVAVAYGAAFLGLFALALTGRAIGLALQRRGWRRRGALLVDLVALAPALGFLAGHALRG